MKLVSGSTPVNVFVDEVAWKAELPEPTVIAASWPWVSTEKVLEVPAEAVNVNAFAAPVAELATCSR